MNRMREKQWGGFAVACVCVIASGCRGNSIEREVFPSANDTAVYVLFDISGSTNSAQVRESYLRDLDAIQGDLVSHGGVLRGDVIGSEALNTSTVPINVTFEPYDTFHKLQTTDERHNKQIRDVTEALQKQVKSTLDDAAPSSATAIMASLDFAAKILNGDQLRNAKRKALIVFSDMIEESPQYNFTRENLTDSRIRAIVSAERAAGRLPDLHGVEVWKAGASAEHLSDERSRQLQEFWIEYFKASGAELKADHYGSTLLNFSLD